MDFNTGGRREDDRPLYGGETGRRSGGHTGGHTGGPSGGPGRGPIGGGGGEFNLQDPVGTFISTVQGVVLNPVGFFRGIARQGGFVNSLVFALICWEVSAILGGLIGLAVNPLLGIQTFGQALLGFVITLVLYPLIGAVLIFVFATILFGFVLLIIQPSGTGRKTTLRTVSYASAAALVAWIPVVGIFVGFIWFVVLTILGTREMHTTTIGRAVVTVLIPTAMAVVFVIAVLVLVIIAVASLSR